MTGANEWNTKEEKIPQYLLWALGPKATHQITKSEHRTEAANIKIAKLIKLYNRHYLPKRSKYNSGGDFFWATQTDTETPEDHSEKLLEKEKEFDFPEFSTKLLISKIIKSFTDRKLRDKLLKVKYLDVPKVVEQTQQIAYVRKNKNNTIPEALISNREKNIKEKPIYKIAYTGQYGTRSKERHKDQNCRHYDAPGWNSNHKRPARDVLCHKCKKKGHSAKACRLEQQKRQEIKELRETAETDESVTDRPKK